MRVAAAFLLLAVSCLTGTSVLWLRATVSSAGLPDGAGPEAMLTSFERAAKPAADIDLAARYAGRLELIDPRVALPTWHEHARDEAVAVHVAARSCPPAPLRDAATLRDAALAKAYAWHAAVCGGGAPPEDEIRRPPFMHPSGRSYAALTRARLGERFSSWAREHVRDFHVMELGSLDPSILEPADRVLAAIEGPAWEALARGDRVVRTPSWLVLAERGGLGLTRVRVYSRTTWESFASDAALALAARSPEALCVRPASPELCWEARSPVERHRSALRVGTIASAAMVLCSSLAFGIAYTRERRRLHRDRIHVLRTLTHELRTPATSLRLDIEPLRDAYDDLPAGCQEPLLRISEGIERLQRVLHRTARYMAHGPFYKIFSRGRARDASHLVGLTVKRLPDELLLDKKTNRGAFELRDDEPGFEDFVLEAKVQALPADGVFTIRLELDDGRVAEGWFIGHDLEATASPEVTSPTPSATLSDPNPRVSWLPFRTPEYSAFERRTLSVWVDQEGNESNNWDFWTGEPGDIDGVRIGAHPETRAKKLAPGDYWLSVGFHELRDFGPIRIQRASSTVLPFRVVH